VAKVIGMRPRFLGNLSEAAKKTPLEQPEHWIEVPEGCAPWRLTPLECSTIYHDLPRVACAPRRAHSASCAAAT
jgi:hypothetical protein